MIALEKFVVKMEFASTEQTGLSVSVHLDLLENNARLTLTNVLVSTVVEMVSVWIKRMASTAYVISATLERSARLILTTVLEWTAVEMVSVWTKSTPSPVHVFLATKENYVMP